MGYISRVSTWTQAMEFPVYTPQQLGEAIRVRRKRLGLTQAAAGSVVGLRPKTISALETEPERSSVRTLFRILSALGLEIVLRPKAPIAPSNDVPW
jgi:HTH-type transcriptional regulator/antitoxin HipB